jgi:hypothetical protein
MAAGPAHGPMPTDEGLRWFDEHETKLVNAPVAKGLRGVVEAMVGNFDRARALVAESRARHEELGQRLMLAGSGLQLCQIEMLAGDAEAAAGEGVRTCEALEAIGERGWLSTIAGQTAQALLELGRDDEAWIDVADEVGGPEDVITQALILQVRARLLARSGRAVDGEALARRSVDLVDRTDMLEARADARVDLAAVLRADGRSDEALTALHEAEELYRLKQHLVGVARVQSLVADARAGV